MSKYDELVKALRCDEKCWDNKCQYLESSSYNWCNTKRLCSDAAAAIEELQAEVDKANKSADAYRAMYFTKRGDITIEKVRELDEIDCHFHSALIRLMYKRIEELEAEVKRLEPKRGEWADKADEIDKQFGRHMYVCSICGKQPDFFVSGTEDWWPSKRPNYCPNCGAKMEVQE